VLATAALLTVLQAATPGGADGLVLREPVFGTAFRVDPAVVSSTASEELSGGGALELSSLPGAEPPPCAGDVCQPRVSVPGFEPKLEMRGKRTELFLALLDHVHFEPIATLAWAIAATGVRLDYTPGAMSDGPNYARGGWGRFQVYLSFRLDAANERVAMERPGRAAVSGP
jgi:hypothetical protein